MVTGFFCFLFFLSLPHCSCSQPHLTALSLALSHHLCGAVRARASMPGAHLLQPWFALQSALEVPANWWQTGPGNSTETLYCDEKNIYVCQSITD